LSDLPRPFLGDEGVSHRCATPPPLDPGVFPSAGALAELADDPPAHHSPHDYPQNDARDSPRDDTSEIAVSPIVDDYSQAVLTPLPNPTPPPSPERDMGKPLSTNPTSFPLPEPRLPVDLPRLLREAEEAYIRLALEQAGGNKKEAARLLGMGRTTLVEKLRRKAALACDGADHVDGETAPQGRPGV
jgi:hypothetical protein